MAGPLASGRSQPVHIPRLNRDPVWSLRSWPVIVRVAGQEHEMPAMSAADWLTYLMAQPPDLDGLVRDHLPQVEELLFSFTVDVDTLNSILLDVIEQVSARRWWIAMRLVSIARGSWDRLGAELVLAGVQADKMSLAAWLDALVLVIYQNISSEEAAMFGMQLESVPPGEVAVVDEEELEMSADSFLSLGD